MKNPLVTRLACIGSFVAVWVAIPGTVEARPVAEVTHRESGWNVVWVNLEPEPNDLQPILGQQAPVPDCQSVWGFGSKRGLLADDSADVPGRWFFFDRDVAPTLNSLRTLQGPRAYLIRMNAPGTMRLSGRPVI